MDGENFKNVVDKIIKGSHDDTEQHLYTLLHKKYDYPDPYEKGLDPMIELDDAFFQYLSSINQRD